MDDYWKGYKNQVGRIPPTKLDENIFKRMNWFAIIVVYRERENVMSTHFSRIKLITVVKSRDGN